MDRSKACGYFCWRKPSPSPIQSSANTDGGGAPEPSVLGIRHPVRAEYDNTDALPLRDLWLQTQQQLPFAGGRCFFSVARQPLQVAFRPAFSLDHSAMFRVEGPPPRYQLGIWSIARTIRRCTHGETYVRNTVADPTWYGKYEVVAGMRNHHPNSTHNHEP